ncbi:MAG TPA: DegT/DnrJ/EryC1/StrS aminotransferase family protein [Candidatus Saccharimonadia bacterium]|nr:DegT/DnrJ/EryC1/StrS aminotransferase family protein [Candidatus Saccharimonadia bacterium]
MIKLIKSSFHHEAQTKRALADFILNESMLSMNKQCASFEQAFAAKQERKFAVYVGNGSVANLLLIQAMMNLGKLKRGDKVGFSALTWPTNVMPLIQLGLEPVAIDCRLETLNVSPHHLEEKAEGLKALFLTNVLGFCDDLPRLAELCAEKGITLIEDNCESLGSRAGGKLLGNFGMASTFSFFVGHHMSTIEGGMICTDDDELHDQLVMARAHGWDRNLTPQKQEKLRTEAGVDAFYAKYTFYDLASNFRPTEINGFIGNIQVKFWDEIVSKRVGNFDRFCDAMNQNDDFHHYDLSHMEIVSNFSMPIICKTPELAQQYRDKFTAAEVEIRPVIAGNMTKQPFYKKYVQDVSPRPNSDLVHANGFYFGNNPEMTDAELDILCGLLGK